MDIHENGDEAADKYIDVMVLLYRGKAVDTLYEYTIGVFAQYETADGYLLFSPESELDDLYDRLDMDRFEHGYHLCVAYVGRDLKLTEYVVMSGYGRWHHRLISALGIKTSPLGEVTDVRIVDDRRLDFHFPSRGWYRITLYDHAPRWFVIHFARLTRYVTASRVKHHFRITRLWLRR